MACFNFGDLWFGGRCLLPNVYTQMISHFSAGIGRTGTFIVIDMILNQIREQGESMSTQSLLLIGIISSLGGEQLIRYYYIAHCPSVHPAIHNKILALAIQQKLLDRFT